MVHSKKVPEAVNLQAVQAALRMLQMNTTQEGVENYFGNELSLLAKMAGFQTNISPPFIDKCKHSCRMRNPEREVGKSCFFLQIAS